MATGDPEPAPASDMDLQQRVVRLEQETAELRQLNTELTRELGESLEQQTATAEVLQVISRSAFDLQPVLETLIQNAARLTGASQGAIFRLESDAQRMAAHFGASPEIAEFLRNNPV